MKKLALLLAVALPLPAAADYSVTETAAYDAAVKDLGSSVPEKFAELYIASLPKNGRVLRSLIVPKPGALYAIWWFDEDQTDESRAAILSGRVTDRGYEKHAWLKYDLIAGVPVLSEVGSSFLQPRGFKRGRHEMVEQEVFYLRGANAGTALIENW